MQLATVNTQNMRLGTCPHGLPIGACPICNGMMGGGGGAKKADFSAKPGEMSWNECAAIGALLRAQKLAHQAKEADFQARIQAMAQFQNTMANAADKAIKFAQFVQNSAPAIIAKPIAFIMNNIVAKGLNFIKDLPVNLANFTQNISQKLADVAAKLTSVYGELKAAITKNFGEIKETLKKKLKSIFSIFRPKEDTEEKVEESKRTFELKTFIHKLYRKIKDDKDKSAA